MSRSNPLDPVNGSKAKDLRKLARDEFDRDVMALLITIANELKRQGQQLQRVEDRLDPLRRITLPTN